MYAIFNIIGFETGGGFKKQKPLEDRKIIN
jgi:hypothetical protein